MPRVRGCLLPSPPTAPLPTCPQPPSPAFWVIAIPRVWLVARPRAELSMTPSRKQWVGIRWPHSTWTQGRPAGSLWTERPIGRRLGAGVGEVGSGPAARQLRCRSSAWGGWSSTRSRQLKAAEQGGCGMRRGGGGRALWTAGCSQRPSGTNVEPHAAVRNEFRSLHVGARGLELGGEPASG